MIITSPYNPGLGQASDGGGFLGTGLFSGTWGFPEWALIGFGAWWLLAGKSPAAEKRSSDLPSKPFNGKPRRSRRY